MVCSYEGKLALPNGITGSEFTIPIERHYANISQANKVLM